MSTTPVQRKPETFLGWIELALWWFYTSVLWGLVPILVTLLFVVGIGISPDFNNEFRVGATVLALSLCGTQLADDIAIPKQQLMKWKWLKGASIIIIAFGGITAALNVLSSNSAKIQGLEINFPLLNASATVVFASALLVTFAAYIVKVIVWSQSVEEYEAQNRKELIKTADNLKEVDGIKL